MEHRKPRFEAVTELARQATHRDVDQIFNLVRRIPDDTYLHETERSAIENKLTNGTVFVVERMGRIVAMIAWKPNSEDSNAVYIDDIAVDPQFKRHGYGKKLMSLFEAHVPRTVRATLLVHPHNKPAIELYRNHHFISRKFVSNPFGDGKLWLEMMRIPRVSKK